MSDSFDGILVPMTSPDIIEAFKSFRPQVPLRMSCLEQRLVGIARYKSGFHRPDYERLANRMCQLTGVAVILHFDDESGSTFRILDRRHAPRDYGPTYETGQDSSEMCDVVKATFDEIEQVLRGGSGELVYVNIPPVVDAIHRIRPEEFSVEHFCTRPRLISQAESADRMITNGNSIAAAKLLKQLLVQLESSVTIPARYFARGIFEAWLEELEQ